MKIGFMHSLIRKEEKLLLEEFAKHRSYIVRTAAGLNSNAPTQVLESLSRDLEWGVRASVAENQSTPSHILEKLSVDLILEPKTGCQDQLAPCNKLPKAI